MAILDPRLLPLIETLSAVGADWLAFELVDAARRGREPEEDEDALARTRAQVRDGAPTRAERAEPGDPPTPILGDDQIEWAASFIQNRIDGALEDLRVSAEALDAIASTPDPARARDGAPAVEHKAFAPVEIALDGEVSLGVSRDDIAQASGAMIKLRTALERWSRDARGELLR